MNFHPSTGNIRAPEFHPHSTDTPVRTLIIAGNWKMNGSQAMALEIASAIVDAEPGTSGIEVIICPPATLLPVVSHCVAKSGIHTGAQDIDHNPSGAFTGQVSAALAMDAGASHVIIGHSERRTLYGETDQLVASKVEAALARGLVPILCLGETRQERENDQTFEVVDRQLGQVLDQLGNDALAGIIIAYEPVWAIGTGLTATPEQAQEVHAHIRDQLGARDSKLAGDCRILYGGSMKPDNAESLTAQPDIDGGLIGGASLNATDFLSICKAAAKTVAR